MTVTALLNMITKSTLSSLILVRSLFRDTCKLGICNIITNYDAFIQLAASVTHNPASTAADQKVARKTLNMGQHFQFSSYIFQFTNKVSSYLLSLAILKAN